MAYIYLMRHARTIMNIEGKWQGISDSSIPEESMAHFRERISFFKDKGIKGIYSSCLARSIRSATEAASILGIGEIEAIRGFNERDLGLMDGKTNEQIREAFGVVDIFIGSRSIEKIPMVEPWPDFVDRVMKTLDKFRNKDRSLIVTHGGVMRAIYNTLTGSNERRVIFDNGYVMKLEFSDSWKISEIIGSDFNPI
ncbi:histidine phosphatase family protein [Thermoplasma sp. Kam2015]|uniref:histidine phosphatase family protein n=1 Tax=Thermoplasma sp. Kam2015 TaxID=2094122 RepID=UPI000D862EB7|nr:histidine phosphatase family protein [Thermoplasma sp. Kam2015]PYB68363.1 histidine phosphatase family protein [Thermoplasma sp. Kam2015]